MSYILEALRKAERERNLGQAPGLADVAQTVPPPLDKPRRLPLVLGALTLVLASALLWSLLRTPPAAPVAPPPVIAAPAPSLPAPNPTRTPVAEAAVEDNENLATLDDLVPATVEPGPPAPPPAAAVITAPPVAEPPIAELALPPAEIEPTPAPAAAEEPQIGTLQLDPSPIPGVKKLGDMPASYRAEFPRLIVDVHASNAEPRRRFVLINGRRYKETEALPEGPVIVEIPDGGIVFDYRGERVMVPLAR